MAVSDLDFDQPRSTNII